MPRGSIDRLPAVVLLDLDDTLFDHSYTARAALDAVRRDTGALSGKSLNRIWEEYLRLLDAIHPDVLAGRVSVEDSRRERFRRLAAYCGADISPAQAHDLSQLYRSAYQRERRAVPGARAFLERLHGRTVVAVVSNNQLREQDEKLAYLGLRGLIDVLVVSEEVGVPKPDPRIFEVALERAGAAPAEAVMFGDSWKADVLGARSVGVRAVWFNRFRLPNPEPGVVREVRSLRDPARVERALSETTAGVRRTRRFGAGRAP